MKNLILILVTFFIVNEVKASTLTVKGREDRVNLLMQVTKETAIAYGKVVPFYDWSYNNGYGTGGKHTKFFVDGVEIADVMVSDSMYTRVLPKMMDYLQNDESSYSASEILGWFCKNQGNSLRIVAYYFGTKKMLGPVTNTADVQQSNIVRNITVINDTIFNTTVINTTVVQEQPAIVYNTVQPAYNQSYQQPNYNPNDYEVNVHQGEYQQRSDGYYKKDSNGNWKFWAGLGAGILLDEGFRFLLNRSNTNNGYYTNNNTGFVPYGNTAGTTIVDNVNLVGYGNSR